MPVIKKVFLFLLIFTLSSSAALKLGEVKKSSRISDGLKNMHGDAFISSIMIGLRSSSYFSAINKNDTIEIPISSEKSVKVVRTKQRTTVNGGLYWRGVVIGNEEGYCDLFVRNKLISGAIYLSDIVYKLDALSSNSIRLVTLDPDARPEIHNCGIDSKNCKNDKVEILKKTNRSKRAPIYVDLLILYPSQIETQMGGATAMENEILFRIEEANEAFENSLMDTRFRLAHHQVISTSEIPAAALSASNVSGSSLAVSLRKQYKADLVSHWNYGGTAGSGNNYNSSYSSAYNTSNFSDVQSRYTFVHECGHNMGGKHDRYTYIIQNRENELEDYYYKYGHMFDYGSNTARTIMAYNQCSYVGIGGSCTRVPYFSNPNVEYNGAVTGIEDPNKWAAYNAKRIDECSPTVSEFEDGNPVILYTLTVNGGAGDGNYEPGVEVSISADDPVIGKIFDKWTGDVSSVVDVNSSNTTIAISNSDLTITATYKDEVIDTVDGSPNLVEIAGWEVDHDNFGNSSVDTGSSLIINDVVKANFIIGSSDEPNDIWPYGSVTAYLDSATDISMLKYIKITYKSDKPIYVSLPQSPLADSGTSYMYEIPASTSDTTVLLEVAKFNQPDWIESYQKADLDLNVVKAISFEMTADGSGQTVEIIEVILYGYDLPVAILSEKSSIGKDLAIRGIDKSNINISIPISGDYSLEIYSLDGKLIKSLNKSVLNQGIHKISWNGLNLASKLYFVTLEGMGMKTARKFILKADKF